jgi:hypothetical protein
MSSGFVVGDVIHGFAGGAFGRDSYGCRTVEAVGTDWVVTRNSAGAAEFASGDSLHWARLSADDRSYCTVWGCDAEEG